MTLRDIRDMIAFSICISAFVVVMFAGLSIAGEMARPYGNHSTGHMWEMGNE
jgi:hypothetical protein